MCYTEDSGYMYKIKLTFSTKADLMPTENSLSPPPKNPTGPAYIPLSNASGQKKKK